MTREALAGFLPAFERPDFRAGEMRGGEATEPGTFTMPYVEYSDTVQSFIEAAHRHQWILDGFDWGAWAHSAEAMQLRDNNQTLAEATPEQLRKLLTVCIRQDRFVEGALLNAFESGLILRIVRRAAALVENGDTAPSATR